MKAENKSKKSNLQKNNNRRVRFGINRQVWAVAKYSVLESLRDRILYVLIGIGLVLVAFGLFLGSISLDQDKKIIIDLGLSTISITGLIIAVIIGGNIYAKEVNSNNLFIFSKPIKIHQYIWGKWLGLITTVTTMVVTMGALLVALAYYRHTGHYGDLVIAIIAIVVELCVISAIMIFLASFTSAISSTIYTVLIYLAGHSMSLINEIITKQTNQFIKYGLTALYYIMPNLEKFNIKNQVVYSVNINGTQAVTLIAYAAVYVILLLLLARQFLKKWEF